MSFSRKLRERKIMAGYRCSFDYLLPRADEWQKIDLRRKRIRAVAKTAGAVFFRLFIIGAMVYFVLAFGGRS